MSMSTEPLFFEPEVLEHLEKTAGEVDLPEDPNQWPQEILQELYKQVPYISDFTPHVEMQKVDAEQGYGIGHIEVQNQTEAPGESDDAALEAAGVRTVRIPFVVKQSKLSPFDLLVTDNSRVLPLTENRLRQAIFRPQAFDVTSRTPGDQSMIGQLYPPYRQNYGFGGGGMAMNAGGGMGAGKMGSANSALEEFVAELEEKDGGFRKESKSKWQEVAGAGEAIAKKLTGYASAPGGGADRVKNLRSMMRQTGHGVGTAAERVGEQVQAGITQRGFGGGPAIGQLGRRVPIQSIPGISGSPLVQKAEAIRAGMGKASSVLHKTAGWLDTVRENQQVAKRMSAVTDSVMQEARQGSGHAGPLTDADFDRVLAPREKDGGFRKTGGFVDTLRDIAAPGSGKIRELRKKELAAAQGVPKTASILQAILPTINRTDHENFCLEVEKCAANIYANRDNIFETVCRVVDAEPAPLLKTASWEGWVRPTVVQIQHIQGGYIVKEASHMLWDPKSALVSRGEIVERFGVKIAADVDTNGAVTLAEDAQAEGGDTKANLEPIADFGLYKVRDEAGKEHVGFVVPNLIDTDGSVLPLQLFTNGTVSAVQADILGEPAGAGGNLPSGEVKGHGAFYTVDPEGKVQMTVPLELGDSFSMPGEPAVFNGESFSGEPVEVSVQPNIKAVMATPEGRMLVPDTWSWLPLQDAQAVGLVSGEASVEAETPEETVEKDSHVVVRSDGQVFSFTGAPVEKLASVQRQDLDVDGAMFLLAALGTHQGYGAEKLASASYLECPVSIKTGRAIGCKDELVKEANAKAAAFLAHFPQLKTPHMLKEAANFPDPSIVDTVLSLGFVNPENIITFVSYLPDIEDAQSKLCELLLATRLGLQNIPQSSLERAIRSLEEVIEGLKILAFQGT